MSSRRSLPTSALALSALLCTVGFASPRLRAQDRSAQTGKPLVFQGAKIFDGHKVLEGATLVVVDGKVQALGKGLSLPDNAVTIDCKGRWITPGLIDANCAIGLPSSNENEQSNEITPHLRIVDLYDVEAKSVERARQGGVTTAYLTPGGLNVFGGLGAIVKTAGSEPILDAESGLRMTLGNMPGQGNRPFRSFGKPEGLFFRRPQNRMGVIWEVRKAFYDAMEARETSVGPTKKLSASTQTLIRALDKKLVVRTTARADQDIRTAIRLAKEFGIQITLDEAIEAYACLDYIVASGFPVIATAPSLRSAPDNATPHLDTIALLAKAGVPLAIQSGQNSAALPLIREAAFAVRGGLSRQAALAAVTSLPAKILGIEDRVGSLAPGKDADLVIWSDHPLRLGTRAETVYIAGVER